LWTFSHLHKSLCFAWASIWLSWNFPCRTFRIKFCCGWFMNKYIRLTTILFIQQPQFVTCPMCRIWSIMKTCLNQNIGNTIWHILLDLSLILFSCAYWLKSTFRGWLIQFTTRFLRHMFLLLLSVKICTNKNRSGLLFLWT